MTIDDLADLLKSRGCEAVWYFHTDHFEPWRSVDDRIPAVGQEIVDSFEEFVREVREQKRSEILLMPHFFEPLQLRLVENAWHTLADAPGEFGRRHWMTRVFIEEQGVTKALSQFMGTRFHRVIDRFRWVVCLAANPMLRPALKLPFLGNEEGGL